MPQGEAQKAGAGVPDHSHGEDLLAAGVRRFLSAARYDLPGGRHARIRHKLGRRSLPMQVPAEWVRSSGDAPRAAGRGGRGRSGSPPAARAYRSIGVLDIESLGFIGRPLFLIGVLYARPIKPARGRASSRYLVWIW